MNTTTQNQDVCMSINRTFNVAVSRVWKAFTDPEWMCKWNCGNWYDPIALDTDLREGGVIHQRVRAKEGGTLFTFHGVYQEIVPNKKLVHTFDWKPDWREAPTPSLVTVEFMADDGKTILNVVHSKMGDDTMDAEKHWNAFLDKLAEFLEN